MNKSVRERSILKPVLKLFVLLIAVVIIAAAVRLRSLAQEVRVYKVYWDNLARKQQGDGAITYVALGDSAAQGIGASTPMNGYVGLLAKEFETNTSRPVYVVNLSVSGATIESLIKDQLPRLASVKNLESAVITLDIGANDVTSGLIDKAEFERKLDKLYSQLPRHTAVADLPSFSRTRLWHKEPKIKEFNSVIYKLAKKHGLRVAPVYDATASDTSWSKNSADIFHPSDRGYRNWAGGFLKVL